MDTSMTQARTRSLLSSLVAKLPEGRSLPEWSWRRRHHAMITLVVLQACALFVFGVVRGMGLTHSAVESGVIVAAATAGRLEFLGRKSRMAAVALGLMLSAAVFTHLSGGLIEAHFAFFVLLGVIALYHHWLPFLVAIGFVLLHHAVLGAFLPEAVFNHSAAREQPLLWASFHAVMVGAGSIVAMIGWRLNERERGRAEQVLDSTADGVFGLDLEGRITFVNQAAKRLLGQSDSALLGADHHDALRHAQMDGSLYHRAGCPICTAVKAATGVPASAAQFGRPDETFFQVEYLAAPLLERNVQTGTVVTFTDLTEQEILTRRALHDWLTGLPNRTLFLERLQQALTRLERHDTLVAVLFIDLDRFKVINDSLGHGAGDELLKEAAGRLATAVRTQDTVARFGGDEFVVLLEDVSNEHAVFAVAERIIATFNDAFHLNGSAASASASVGITITADHDANPEDLLRDADAAMYRAKESGRNRYEVFDDEMRVRAVHRLEIESDLRRALEEGELRVHYQPSVSLQDERLLGVEALVRWEHPQKGTVMPNDFIPVAEETGQIVALGAWVLEEACRQVQEWRTSQPQYSHLKLSVNLSTRQLAQPDLVATVATALARTGFPGALLCLEITESVLMLNADAAARTLEDLKRLGVTIAVDDFGTGYSSLSYLTRFPVDALKVDRAFVANLGETADSWSVVAAVIGLSQALGLDTVAEGVEYGSQAMVLRNLGCQAAQGYHFARPQPPEQLEALLNGRAAEAPVGQLA